MPAPEAYSLSLPADLKLPEGVAFRIDETNPVVPVLRAWANKNGLPQDQFSELMGAYAQYQAAENSALADRSRAEVAKAGPNATARVDAISKWITSEAGETDAKPIIATLVTDAHLRFYEKLNQKIVSQGAASFSQQHRASPDGGKIPGFDKMSFAQQRHAQEQMRTRKTA